MHQEVSVIELPVTQVELRGAVGEADAVDRVEVIRLVEGVVKDLQSAPIVLLLELVSSLQKDGALLDLIYLAAERNFIVEPQVHRVIAKVDQG